MSACSAFPAGGPAGIADALSKVDCLASDATRMSFAHLFGENGSFRVALTILLTLYVALLALNLLTGRSALRLSTLTPRMMTMGLVLTFVTSWIAYQSVVWNLAVGAPDEIAGAIVGTKGSATTIFAERLDVFFDAITRAADAVKAPSPANIAAMPSTALMSPGSVLSLAAIILLLGTVGVLVACRLALAALLILGPIFIVLALFQGTRGLFEGWLKSVATFAFVPLLTVLLGSGALLALDPMVAELGNGGEITLRTAVTILVVAVIYLGLMFLAFKTAANLASSWRIGKQDREIPSPLPHVGQDGRAMAVSPFSATSSNQLSSDRVRTAIIGLGMSSASDRSSTSRTASSVTTRSISQLAAPTSPSTTIRRNSSNGHRLKTSFSNPRQGLVK